MKDRLDFILQNPIWKIKRGGAGRWALAHAGAVGRVLAIMFQIPVPAPVIGKTLTGYVMY